MKTFEYYYDYTPEAYNYIMASKILRNRDKNILKDLVNGKKVKEIAINNSWDDTYKHLSNIARLNGTMMDDKDFIIKYLDERYDRIYNLPKTVGEVAGTYSDNILLITMKGHIVCSKYGVIYDSFDCRDRIAEYCWKIK